MNDQPATATPALEGPPGLSSGPVKGPSDAGPRTLAIDIGGTGLKASVLDDKGAMLVDRVRIPTTYPLAPQALIDALRTLGQAVAECLPEGDEDRRLINGLLGSNIMAAAARAPVQAAAAAGRAAANVAKAGAPLPGFEAEEENDG